MSAAIDDAGAGLEVGKTGRSQQCARPDPRHRLAVIVGVLSDPIGSGVLIPAERGVENRDPSEPLHLGHAVPAGHQQAQRGTVLRRERLAVHGVHEQHVVAERLVERQAALVVLLDPALDAVVSTSERHLDSVVMDACLTQQRRQRRARPVSRADRLVEPGLADRARSEPGPAVPGAFERDAVGNARPRLDGGEVERRWTLDVAIDPQPPGPGVEIWDVVVDQQVVQSHRCDVIAQRLQRHAVVARREPQFVEGNAFAAIGDPCRRADRFIQPRHRPASSAKSYIDIGPASRPRHSRAGSAPKSTGQGVG